MSKENLVASLKPLVLSPIFNMVGDFMMFAVFMYLNLKFSYSILNKFPLFITRIIGKYHTNPQLFDSVPCLLHVYFGFIMFAGIPIVLIMSLASGISHFKKNSGKRFIFNISLPITFILASYFTSEIWLSFI